MSTTITLPSQPVIIEAVGPMVLGILIQQILLGVTCHQTSYYLRRHFRKDPWFERTIVLFLILLNVFLGVTNFYVFYRFCVLRYGNFNAFDVGDWATFIEPSLAATIGLVTHVFFLMRCWQIVKSRICVSLLAIISLASFVSGLAMGIVYFSIGRLSNLDKISTSITLWLLFTCICDTSMASFLGYHTWKSRIAVNNNEKMIFLLRCLIMETGSLAAMCTLLNFIVYMVSPITNYYFIPQACVPRLYTISVLYGLLSRERLCALSYHGSGTASTRMTESDGNAHSHNIRARGRGQSSMFPTKASTLSEIYEVEASAVADDLERGISLVQLTNINQDSTRDSD